MWPHDATWNYTVRGTVRQITAWHRAAEFLGIPVPVYLATAATRYAKNLERRVNRIMKKLDQEKQEQGG